MHDADAIVTPGAGQHTSGAVTKLEAAELKRRTATLAELDRHRQAMDDIAREFAQEMTIA